MATGSLNYFPRENTTGIIPEWIQVFAALRPHF